MQYIILQSDKGHTDWIGIADDEETMREMVHEHSTRQTPDGITYAVPVAYHEAGDQS